MRLAALLPVTLPTALSLAFAMPATAADYANPGAVIAAEANLQRLAEEKGLWTAMLELAAPGARLFQPEPVVAADWLKDRTNPTAAPRWQPHEVWSSCDGSFAFTRGAWLDGSQPGRFVTLWQRQVEGGYKWVLRLEQPVAAPLAVPEMIVAKVAQCPPAVERTAARPPAKAEKRRRKARPEPAAPPFDPVADKSDDATMEWRSGADSHGSPYFTFALKADGVMPELTPAL